MTLLTNTYMSDEDTTELELNGFSVGTIPAYRYAEGLGDEIGAVRFGRELAYDGDANAEETRNEIRAGFSAALRTDETEFASRELARLVRMAVASGYVTNAAEAIAALDDFAPSEVLAQRAWTKLVAKAVEESDDLATALSLMAQNPGVLAPVEEKITINEALAEEAALDEMVTRSILAEGRLGRKLEIRKDAEQIRRAARALAQSGDLKVTERGYTLVGKTWSLTASAEGLIVWAEKLGGEKPQARRANPTRKGGKAGRPGEIGAVKASAATAAPVKSRRKNRRRGRNAS
jgi:hypothetical protein